MACRVKGRLCAEQIHNLLISESADDSDSDLDDLQDDEHAWPGQGAARGEGSEDDSNEDGNGRVEARKEKKRKRDPVSGPSRRLKGRAGAGRGGAGRGRERGRQPFGIIDESSSDEEVSSRSPPPQVQEDNQEVGVGRDDDVVLTDDFEEGDMTEDVIDREELEGEGGDGEERGRRKKLRNRLVNSLNSSLEKENYQFVGTPTEVIEYDVIMKGTHIQEEQKISWTNKRRPQVGRRSQENLIWTKGGVKDQFKGITDPVEAWKLFLDDDLLDKIVECTNKSLDKRIENRSAAMVEVRKNQHVKPITKLEFLAYIGLMYCQGAWQLNNFDYHRIWRRDLAVPVFPATMSSER